MSKYIPAEKLIAEIERLKGKLIRGACAAQVAMETNCKDETYNEVLSFITYLQKEQPEVDLDREIIKYKVPFTEEGEYLYETTLDAIARHFAEWGAAHLNARKEDSYEAQ